MILKKNYIFVFLEDELVFHELMKETVMEVEAGQWRRMN
jgi:hypothetical protein